MEYYIEPAEQTDEVKAQLATTTPSTLNPEELTFIDPASGSGHILVEAYELFKAIYLERGYRQRDVPQLILDNNLFGLDIDERAAQLTSFALMMKARADDRRLFERGVKLNVMALVDSAGLDAERLAQVVELSDYGLQLGDLTELQRLFEHATAFGSLIQVPEGLVAKLPAYRQLGEATSHDLFVSDALERLRPLVRQTEMLARQYDAVVANPPYMGSKFYCAVLKKFVNSFYTAGKANLYAAFTLRNIQFSKHLGCVGMITIPNWMFLSSFNQMRNAISRFAPIASLVHNGRGVWGSDFGSCSYVLIRSSPRSFNGRFLRLFDKQGSVVSNEELERRFHANPRFSTSNIEFKKIPGSPVAYWLSERMRDVFEKGTLLGNLVDARQGLATADTDRFLRRWYEADHTKCSYDSESRAAAAQSGKKWFPDNKGGEFRKWYGNQDYLVNWENDGSAIRAFGTEDGGRARSRAQNTEFYFRESLTWSDVTSGPLSFRVNDSGGIHDVIGMSAFNFRGVERSLLAGYCNTPIVLAIARATNPTLHFPTGNFVNIPFIEVVGEDFSRYVTKNVDRLVLAAVIDWDTYERSWDFESLPILTASSEPTPTLESSYTTWITRNRETTAEMKRLEEDNNRLFIDAYGLADELTPEEQKPQANPLLSMNDRCSVVSRPTSASPSMVVISSPARRLETGTVQLVRRRPLISTLQAPQIPTPQPNLVPVSPSRSRSAHSSASSRIGCRARIQQVTLPRVGPPAHQVRMPVVALPVVIAQNEERRDRPQDRSVESTQQRVARVRFALAVDCCQAVSRPIDAALITQEDNEIQILSRNQVCATAQGVVPAVLIVIANQVRIR